MADGKDETFMKKIKNMEIQVSVTGMDIFKDILNVLSSMCMDERIDRNVRQEYLEQIIKTAFKEEKQ
jgi:uncharacterized protein (UPF0147 family)